MNNLFRRVPLKPVLCAAVAAGLLLGGFFAVRGVLLGEILTSVSGRARLSGAPDADDAATGTQDSYRAALEAGAPQKLCSLAVFGAADAQSGTLSDAWADGDSIFYFSADSEKGTDRLHAYDYRT